MTAKPAICVSIVGNELAWGEVATRRDYVASVDIAVHRLLLGEEIWLQQVATLVNCTQRTVTMALEKIKKAAKDGDS